MYKKRKFIKFRVDQSPQKDIFNSFYGKPLSPDKSLNQEFNQNNGTSFDISRLKIQNNQNSNDFCRKSSEQFIQSQIMQMKINPNNKGGSDSRGFQNDKIIQKVQSSNSSLKNYAPPLKILKVGENVRKSNSAMKTHQRTNTNQQINQYFNISDGKANLKIDQNQIYQSPDINPYRDIEETPKRTYGLTSQEVNNLDIQLEDEHQDNLSSKLHQSILQQSQSIKDMKLSQASHQSSIRVNNQAIIKKSPSSGISENISQQAIYSSYNKAKPQVKNFKQVTSNTGTNSKYISLSGSPPNFPISYSNQPSQSSSLFGFDLAMIGNKLTDVLGMNKERMFNNPVLLKDYQQGPNTHRLNNNSQQYGFDNARNHLPYQQKIQNNYDFSKLVKDSEYNSPVASQRNAQQDSTAQASRFVNRNIPQHQKNDTTHQINLNLLIS